MIAMTNEEYVKHRGILCPNCRKVEGVNEGQHETDGDGGSTVDCWCTLCGAEWTEEHDLARYDNLVVPEKEQK